MDVASVGTGAHMVACSPPKHLKARSPEAQKPRPRTYSVKCTNQLVALDHSTPFTNCTLHCLQLFNSILNSFDCDDFLALFCLAAHLYTSALTSNQESSHLHSRRVLLTLAPFPAHVTALRSLSLITLLQLRDKITRHDNCTDLLDSDRPFACPYTLLQASAEHYWWEGYRRYPK